ncbi:MAG: O-acetyl-ADP-ribose deacetylase [Mycobacteriales bacterium]
MNLSLVLGSITDEQVDAVVNAANSSLSGGGGVDGAIHRAAGPRLMDECRRLRRDVLPDGLPAGEAIAMPGFDLAARWVIATVGPVWSETQAERRRPLLASAYTRSLEVADQVGATSVAFPSISTGAYGWPMADAARVAIEAVSAYEGRIDDVRFVLFHQQAYDAFAAAAS